MKQTEKRLQKLEQQTRTTSRRMMTREELAEILDSLTEDDINNIEPATFRDCIISVGHFRKIIEAAKMAIRDEQTN